MTTAQSPERRTAFRHILAYSTGEGANSLVMNTFFGFAMLYFTKALGMSGKLTGIAMAIVVLWDAITDPVMGHITDNTRSRFGRRHPYMLVGGILTVLCFYFVWAVPSLFRAPHMLFCYLVVMNVLLRTGSTVFAVPYIALGFEVCTDYNQRTTLQGVRTGVNMAVNLLGPALLGWSVFLRDRDGVKGETIAANYQRMGLTFSIVALAFILFMIFATRRYARDSRNQPGTGGNSLGNIIDNLKDVLFDPYPRTVFIFIFVLFMGVVLLTSMQMFVYVDFMEFKAGEKSLVHGSTMVAAGFGALLAASFVRRFDKKPAIGLLLLGACVGNIMLVILFATGWVPKGLSWKGIPIATLVFMLFHAGYHLGSTAATTVANSMMADVSEISRYRTGILKDGSYSAMLSFVLKLSVSLGMLLCGLCLDWIDVVHGAEHQTPEVARRLLYVAFIGGTVITVLAMLVIVRYPVNRAYMAQIQAAQSDGDEPTAIP